MIKCNCNDKQEVDLHSQNSVPHREDNHIKIYKEIRLLDTIILGKIEALICRIKDTEGVKPYKDDTCIQNMPLYNFLNIADIMIEEVRNDIEKNIDILEDCLFNSNKEIREERYSDET